MDEDTIRAFASVVEKSLDSDAGKEMLRRSHELLARSFAEGAFNSDRAQEVYAITIERAVMAFSNGPSGSMYVKTLRESGITSKMASELVDHLKGSIGAYDQRPTRKGLWAKIIGK